MEPVSYRHLEHLIALKSDPRVFAIMLGGVRVPVQVVEELAAEMTMWSRRGVGIWAVFEGRAFVGITGFMERADGRGIALRFAFSPESRGRGLAREAAGAALRFAHEVAGLPRVIAVAREDNIDSRTVLGAIGMRYCESFRRDGYRMLVFESVSRSAQPGAAGLTAPP